MSDAIDAPAGDAGAETVVTNENGGNTEAQSGAVESVAKSYEEMTPEELIAELNKEKSEADKWKGFSRKHEDEVKKLRPLAEKAEQQVNENRPPEQVNADRIAALEAQITESKKEAAVLRLTKEYNLPDEAVELLQDASLDSLPGLAEKLAGLLANTSKQTAATEKPKASLPNNANQGVNPKKQGMSGAELELYNLLQRTK